MISLNLGDFSSLISMLSTHSNAKCIETTDGINYAGKYSRDVFECLLAISEYVIDFNLSSISLKVDDFQEEWADVDFSSEDYDSWELSIADKQEILTASKAISVDIDGLLFFNVRYFEDNWLKTSSGLNAPELSGALNADKPIKLFVHGIDYECGSSKIAVIKTSSFDKELANDWMQSTKLPHTNDVRKYLHVVSNNKVTFSPERYFLTWGDLESPIAAYFNNALTVSLLLTLCQEYYGKEKVVLTGKKRLEVCLYDTLSEYTVKPMDLDCLMQTVIWCYAESDIETRVLLVIDRLTLDLGQNDSLLSAVKLFGNSLVEAKNRYRYVILERKKEYTKELSDLQKDVSTVASTISKSSLDFTDSLLKDILALAFVLTAGVVSRRLVQEDILNSPQAIALFKAFSIYLIISAILRGAHSLVITHQSKSVFLHWKGILRNYMTEQEFLEKVDECLAPVIFRFRIGLAVVLAIYIIMIISCWNSVFAFGLLF